MSHGAEDTREWAINVIYLKQGLLPSAHPIKAFVMRDGTHYLEFHKGYFES